MKIIIKYEKKKVDEVILINFSLTEAKYYARQITKKYEKPYTILLKC